MAATKLQANWSAVSHGSTTITRVTQVSFSQGGSLATYSADGDHYPTVVVNLINKPGASVTSSDTPTLMGIAPGTTATFSATHKDAKEQLAATSSTSWRTPSLRTCRPPAALACSAPPQ
jgi:hypothetical protein